MIDPEIVKAKLSKIDEEYAEQLLITALINHPELSDCKDPECSICGFINCPFEDVLHYHHDGCPSCYKKEENETIT